MWCYMCLDGIGLELDEVKNTLRCEYYERNENSVTSETPRVPLIRAKERRPAPLLMSGMKYEERTNKCDTKLAVRPGPDDGCGLEPRQLFVRIGLK